MKKTYAQMLEERRESERPIVISSEEWTRLAEGWIEADELDRAGEEEDASESPG